MRRSSICRSSSERASFSSSLRWISISCCSSASCAATSCSTSAACLTFCSICCFSRASSASARCCASIPTNESSASANPSLSASDLSSAASLRFASSAARSSSICCACSRMSSLNASLFTAIYSATMKSGTSFPAVVFSSSSRLSSMFCDCSSLISAICSLITARISACSFSILFAFGLTVIERHDWPKRRQDVPSAIWSLELLSARIICSKLDPPSPLASIIVSFDSRNGICAEPSARHLTTRASLVSDRLILIPSFMF
mmetsp:Transcript_8106/g.20107  ORF Transcript_8106/g.20107 Transcript_8106/m.20107 type:complete len:260 (+) Transcript_8106:3834-4613(+)